MQESFESDKSEILKSIRSFTVLCVSVVCVFFCINVYIGFYLGAWIDLGAILLFSLALSLFNRPKDVQIFGVFFTITCCLLLFSQSLIIQDHAIHNMFYFPVLAACTFVITDNKRINKACFAITCFFAVSSILVPKIFNLPLWEFSEDEALIYMVLSIVASLLMTFRVGSIISMQKKVSFERLSKALNNLEALNKKNKHLLQIIIHDISTPLVSIDLSVRFATVSKNTSPELTKIANVCDPAISTIREIIESAREMMALEDGKISTKPQAIFIAPLLDETASLLKGYAAKKDVSIHIKNNLPEDTKVWVEPKSFKSSVFTNLLTNAVKFSHRNSEVKVEVQELNDEVIISVLDSGIGMPSQQQERIFDTATKFSRPGTEGEPGTGYGLPLAKSFIESYGGTIECMSEENMGTLMKITLKKVEVVCEK